MTESNTILDTIRELAEATARFDATVDETVKASGELVAECKEIGDSIEQLKNFSIFGK